MNSGMVRGVAQLVWVLTLLCCPAGLLLAQRDGAAGETKPSESEATRRFEAQIAPLLARRCLECHDATSKKGRLDLSRKEAALAGGASGKVIVPGKADDSLLWQYVESDKMPKGRPPLPASEKQLLRQWIDAGAVWSADAIGPFVRDRGGAGNWPRRLTVDEYIETVRSAVGVAIERDARRLLPADPRADGFSNTAYNLHVDLAHIEAYARLAQMITARMDVAAFAAQFAKRQELGDAAMRELIAGMGKWLLRGPLEDHEVESFLGISRAVVKEGGDYGEAVRFIVEAMLQSPRFIYRIERQPRDGRPRRVGDYELAARLSYILWGGPPDKELMRAADAGELSDRGRVEEQVKRMLQDPRAVQRSSRFIYDWMDLDRLANLRPNPSRFPKWNDRLAADMRDETLAFFEEVAWKQNRPLANLLNAQVTFATPRLADHYGLGRSNAVARAAVVPPASAPQRVADGLVALYTFQEQGGDTVRDVSEAGEPLDLTIENASAVRWSDQGLVAGAGALVASARPPQRLIDAIQKSKAVTLEAWITPANTTQSGPARIVTLSADPNGRNFTLGQDGDKFELRFRTTKTDGNGLPGLVSAGGSVQSRLTHVVHTRDAAGKAKVYINGEEKGARDAAGDLSNWDGRFRLALANELTKDRPWQGTLHLVAVYDRALPATDVRQNHAAGARRVAAPAAVRAPLTSQRVKADLQALYTFDEASGDMVRDASATGEPLDLTIENASAVKWDATGLTVNAPTLIAAASPPKRLIDAVKKSRAVTLEAWISPGDTAQSGPARILTLSSGVLQRNFTLGQDGGKYDVRFRGSATDGSGLPSLSSPSGAVQKRPTHVVYTRDAAGKAKLYINGDEKGARDVVGDLANWDGGFRLALANETSQDRPWRGTYHLVAIYSRALSADEVRRNHAAGARQDGLAVLASAAFAGAPAKDVQALYTFDEGAGDTVRDTSGAGEPLDLRIENTPAVTWENDGLQVNLPTLIAAGSPPKRLIDAIKKSNAVALEAWITPADAQQSGPARILTLSSGIGTRNFTLGQHGDTYDVRLRTTKSDPNGQPSLGSKSGSVATKLTHVVFTRDAAGTAKLYLNGVEQASRDMGGDLSNWEGGFSLALANETSRDRPWRGALHRVAIYSRALPPDEVRALADVPAAGGGLARYDLASVPGRGGLLTHGSVLTVGGDEASMVARGLFILNELLYSGVEDPPPCVDTTPVPTKPGQSQRAIAMQRINNQACSACHSKFEPLAFGLEKFDGLGAYHEVDEHGNKLRDDGEILFPDQERPVSYQSSAELMDLLAASPRVRKGITRKVAQFAIGRPLTDSDAQLIDQIHETAEKNGGTYAALITAIVMSDLVQMTEPGPAPE